MRNGKVDDPRDVLFADATDAPESLETLPLDDQIDYAEWCVSVAQAHLDELKRQKAEYDAHIEAQYQAHVDAENGRVACESDAHDCRIREAMHVS